MAKNFSLREFLFESEILDLDVESPERLTVHRKILNRKPLIKNVFLEFHHEIMKLDRKYFGDTQGLRVELGAGVSPIRDSYPDVLSTDIMPSEYLDRELDAQNMDLEGGSVRAIYGQNCFHHFTDPPAFFSELRRVLAPGGGTILIEPYYSPVATLLYKYLFASEGFDKTAPGWRVDESAEPEKANQALSYIIFVRDRKLFAEKFGQLEIVYSQPLLNYLRYFLSGGLNFRPLVPEFMEQPLKGIEWALSPLARILALHYIFVLRLKK